jgi:hypothetical protein
MEILPPEEVFRQIIKGTTAEKLASGCDLTEIKQGNSTHTEEYVRAFIVSLKTEELKIQRAEEEDLTIHVLAPRRIDFIFAARHGKWVDGADHTYYVLVRIAEKTPQPQCAGRD